MTLRQQFSLLTTLLVLVLLLGSLWLTWHNGRMFFQQQLDARAYDAASALALGMSANADDAVRQRQMDAMFDRGFFSRITLTLVSGDRYERQADEALLKPVPDWFRRLMPLHSDAAKAEVMQGWQQLGTVTVQSHTDFAYRDLWHMAKQETAWFAGVAALALLLLQGVLNWLLKPLQQVEQQAVALSERRWQLQHTLPRSRELRRVVEAMNTTVTTLKGIFSDQSAQAQRWHRQAFEDELTGLLNRRGFDQQLQHILSHEEGYSGLLILLQLQGFAEHNQRLGRQWGDDLLVSVGQRLLQILPADSLCGRRSGADFVMFLPCGDDADARYWLQYCFDQLAASTLSPRQVLNFHLGGLWLQGQQGTVSPVLSGADEALRQAQRQPHSACCLLSNVSTTSRWTASQWRQLLQQALQAQAIELHYLPVVAAKDVNQRLQFEVVSRLQCGDQWLAGARFWPMLEQHQLASQCDLLIVEQVLLALAEQQQSVQMCVNISPATLAEERSRLQLLALFKRYPEQAAKLAIELPEFSLHAIEPAVQTMLVELKSSGVALAVDQVGRGHLTLAYLQRLPLDYLRIAGHINRGIHQADDQRFYLEAMVQAAHSRGVSVMAEGIETEQDANVLIEAGVDGVSGYYFSAPLSTPG